VGEIGLKLLKKKIKGLSLMEVVVALGLVSLIALFLLPSFSNIFVSSKKIRKESQRILALEETIEKNKNKDIGDEPYLPETDFDIEVTIEDYAENDKFNKITAKSGTKFLSLVVKKP
jgi:type II secretory pathway pseudopilin PulG